MQRNVKIMINLVVIMSKTAAVATVEEEEVVEASLIPTSEVE